MPHENTPSSIVIGSSPGCLLEATIRAASGERVTVIEREGSVGGAWRVGHSLGYDRVELAPHYLEYSASAYAAITSELGIALERYQYSPRWLVGLPGGRVTALAEQGRWALELARSARQAALNLRKGDRAAARSAALLCKEHLSNLSPGRGHYEYIPGGCASLIDAIAALPAYAKLRFVQGALRELAVSQSGVRTTVAGDELVADRAVITPATELESLDVDGALVPLEYRERANRSVSFTVERSTLRPMSLVIPTMRLEQHPLLLMADVTPPHAAGDRLISAQVRWTETDPQSATTAAENCLELLKRASLARPSASVRRAEWGDRLRPIMTNDVRKRLREAGHSRLQLLETPSMSHTFEGLAARMNNRPPPRGANASVVGYQ